MHQRKAGEQVEIDVNRRKDHIIVVADEDIMIHDAIHEILDWDEKPINSFIHLFSEERFITLYHVEYELLKEKSYMIDVKN